MFDDGRRISRRIPLFHTRQSMLAALLCAIGWLLVVAPATAYGQPEPGEPHSIQWLPFEESPQACGTVDVSAQFVDINGAPIDQAQGGTLVVLIEADSEREGLSIQDTDLDSVQHQDTHEVYGRTAGDREFTVTLMLEDVGEATLHATSPDLAASNPSTPENQYNTPKRIEFGPSSAGPEASEWHVEHDEIFDGSGSAQISVIPRGHCAGQRTNTDHDVDMEASFGELTEVTDAGDGRYEAFFTTDDGECPEEPAVIYATIAGEPMAESATIDVTCGDVVPQSPVEVLSGTHRIDACSDGGDTFNIRVFPRDLDGEPLERGQDVGIIHDAPYLVESTVSESIDAPDVEDSYTINIGAHRCSPEPRPITVYVGGVTLDTDLEIDARCPELEEVHCDSWPARSPTGDERPSQVTIDTVDSCGTPGFDRTIELTTSGDIDASVADDSVTTADAFAASNDGSATVDIDVAPDQSGVATLDMEIDGDSFSCDVRTLIEPARITDPADGDTVGTRPTISGTAEPNSDLIVYQSSPPDISVDADGNWSWYPADRYDEYELEHSPRLEYDLSEGEFELLVVPEYIDDHQEIYADKLTVTVDDMACPDANGCAPDEHRFQGGGGCHTGSQSTPPAWPIVAMALLIAGFALRRRRLQRTATAGLAAIAVGLLVVPAPASASISTYSYGGVDLWHLDAQPVTGGNYISTSGTRTLNHLNFSTGAQFGYGHRPLVAIGERHGDELSLIDGQTHFDISAALGLFERFELAVRLPAVTNFESGESSSISSYSGGSTLAVGDLQAMAKTELRTGDQGLGIGALLSVRFPTSTDRFAGEDYVSPAIELLTEYVFESRTRLSLNLGVIQRPPLSPQTAASSDPLVVGNQLTVRLGAAHPVTDRLELIAEFHGRHDPQFADFPEEAPMELAAAARFEVADGHHLTGGAGPGLTPAYGTPQFRAFVGYHFRTGGVGAALP